MTARSRSTARIVVKDPGGTAVAVHVFAPFVERSIRVDPITRQRMRISPGATDSFVTTFLLARVDRCVGVTVSARVSGAKPGSATGARAAV
jgi:hypothetical protein